MRGKWTEGPWNVEFGDHTHRYVLVTDSDDRTIYYKYGAGTAKAADQDEADAYLIAASPTMFDVLDAAPIISKYHTANGFEAERFIADYEAWSATKRAALSQALPPKGDEL